jgi:TonB family protein
MAKVWVIFGETDWFGWVVLSLSVAGAVYAAVAVRAAVRRSPRALGLGVVAVIAGALCAGIGALGVVRGRTAADRATAAERPVQRERLRREGYRRARSAARVGLALGAIPLLAGAIAVLAAPRRRPEDADLPPGVLAPLRLAAPLGVTAAGLLCAGLGIEAARARLPGRDLSVDDPLWDVLDEVEVLRAARDREDRLRGCRRVGELLDRGLGPRAAEALPDLPRLGSGCVSVFLAHANTKPLAEAIGELEALGKSYFVRSDPEQDRIVQQVALGVPAQRAPERPTPVVTGGAPTVTGKLAPRAIEEAVTRGVSLLQSCYLASDGSYDRIEGEVAISFVIGTEGSVRAPRVERSTMADPRLDRCVLSFFQTLSFPRPESGQVRVTYPVRFSVAAP